MAIGGCLVYYATCVLLIRSGGWPFPLFYCAFIQRVLIILSDNHSGPERVPVQVPLLVCVALHWAVELTLTPDMMRPRRVRLRGDYTDQGRDNIG